MWKIFHTSLEWLNEGMYSLLWNDKQLCYSHTIWIEDTAVIYCLNDLAGIIVNLQGSYHHFRTKNYLGNPAGTFKPVLLATRL